MIAAAFLTLWEVLIVSAVVLGVFAVAGLAIALAAMVLGDLE